MKKTLYLFLLPAIIALGSCKKSCNYPQYQSGKYCFNIQDYYAGDYQGVEYAVWSQTPPYLQSQDIVAHVLRSDHGPNSIIILGLNGTVDKDGNITLPNQSYLQTLYFPYHASGTGSFGDTMVNGIKNISVSLNLSFTADSGGDNGNYTATYFGIR